MLELRHIYRSTAIQINRLKRGTQSLLLQIVLLICKQSDNNAGIR